ncbi:MAG: hypothetical protein IJ743_00415 [Bacilli bacterium]|nr:hypothetical protein [Bacilli bacterium]
MNNLKHNVKNILKQAYPLSIDTGGICRKLNNAYPNTFISTEKIRPKLKKWSESENWIENRGKSNVYYWRLKK